MNCKAKVRTGEKGVFKECSQKATILGLCINHYTMMVYGKKIIEPLKKKGGKND